jgi:hypothetical protein
MSRYPSSALFLVVRGLLILSVCCFLATNSWSQAPPTQNSQNQDKLAITPGSVRVQLPMNPADQEQFIVYWTSETGWKSELQLRNNLAAQDLTVTPALRLPDGSETSLAAVIVKPQELKSVDLDSAITAASAPQLVGTYGSIVLRYRSLSAGNLYAAMMIRRTGHPIAFHVDGLGESQDFQIGSREGVWWLPNDTAKDYLIVSNQGGNVLPLTLSLYDASGRESKQKFTLGPREVARYSVRNLLQSAQLGGSYGGIKVSTPSHAGSLDTLHFLFDEKAEFSAILKMFDNDQNSKLEHRDFAKTGVWTLRTPMLALSSPDAALALPPGTTLHPRLFVRNATDKPVDAAIRFVWHDDKQSGKASGPAVRLNANETRLVDVAALQNAGVLPKEAHWTSVTLTTDGSPDGVVAVAASYDETLRYGAQTPFSDQLTHKGVGGMWEYDPYHSSIITVGNGGTKPTQAAFTIFYHQGAEKYEAEQMLQPDEQIWIDVGKLIREHVPDKNGKMLPADLSMGTYEFRDLTNRGVGTLFEGKVIYDKTYGHVAYGCYTCCGYSNVSTIYNPLGIFFQSTTDNSVQARDNCDGSTYDVGDDFLHWSSLNTAIVTTTSSGTHTGVSVGSAGSHTNGVLENNNRLQQCPLSNFAPGAGNNVKPTVTFGNTPLVPTDRTVLTTATVNPSTNTTAITLTITTNSGTTGAATFADGHTTMTITTTTNLNLRGVTPSSTPNNMNLTATIPSGTVGSMVFTVTGPINGAIPVNYRQTLERADPSAVLHFEYQWDSSSGNKADLANCQIREYVTFIGASGDGNYYWPSPPYTLSYTPSPFFGSTPVSATISVLGDENGHPGFSSPPYQSATTSDDQVFQFTCTYYNSGQWTQIMPSTGTIPVTRLVRSTPVWNYQIYKGPYSNSMNLP